MIPMEEQQIDEAHEDTYHLLPDEGGDVHGGVGLFKGEVQPPAFRDVYFAILFYLHLIGIAGAAFSYGPALARADEADGSNGNTQGNGDDRDDIITTAALFFVTAAFVTTMSLRLMMHHPECIIRVSLFAAPLIICIIALLMSVAVGDDVHSLWIVAAVMAAFSGCLYKYYEKFIPFATSTLKTALTALREYSGLYVLQFGLCAVLFAYTSLWIFAVGGIYSYNQLKGQAACASGDDDSEANQDHDEMCDFPIPLPLGFVLLVCLFWTQQVVQNIVHTTTSGVVGSWWFSPTLTSARCCGQEVNDSFHRAATYSFGSICLGSLLVLVRAWLEYFHSWAFCYVGLYGYDYLSAGRNVARLFKEREWTTFISDRLIFRVLLMANLGVAASTGAVNVLLGCLFTSDGGVLRGLFWIGFVVGFYVSSTILFVVESATRTCIVLFAESAQEFREVHEEEYEELKTGWSTSYPDAWLGVAASRATPTV